MNVADSLSYRFASEVLDSPLFRPLKADIEEIIATTQVPRLATPKPPRRGGRRVFDTDQKELNRRLDIAFAARLWQIHPYIIEGERDTNLRADFKKERVQVEAQFGNMARWYTDVFKFQVSYSLGHIDVGVLLVPMQGFANTIDDNIAHFERVARELAYAKMSITLPVWVVGLTP